MNTDSLRNFFFQKKKQNFNFIRNKTFYIYFDLCLSDTDVISMKVWRLKANELF